MLNYLAILITLIGGVVLFLDLSDTWLHGFPTYKGYWFTDKNGEKQLYMFFIGLSLFFGGLLFLFCISF